MFKYHCKKHWVNAETTLGRTGRHANAQNAYLHTLSHPPPTPVHLVCDEPHHPHLAPQISLPFQITLLPALDNCPKAAPLPKPTSMSKHQVFFRAKYLLSHLCISQPFNKCKLPLIKFLCFLKFITDKFLCGVHSLISPITSVVLIDQFCKAHDF